MRSFIYASFGEMLTGLGEQLFLLSTRLSLSLLLLFHLVGAGVDHSGVLVDLSLPASVRAYRRGQQFILKTESAIDQQNRCYYLTVSIQAWLSIRLVRLRHPCTFAKIGKLTKPSFFSSCHPPYYPLLVQTFLGNLLVLGIALFGVGLRTSVSPSKLGVVLICTPSSSSPFIVINPSSLADLAHVLALQTP
jgi:hypothetical protein